tara:strand:+ start:21 stop:1232 length:1212 start_codon:yes stop_codon:yes gene_type:complete
VQKDTIKSKVPLINKVVYDVSKEFTNYDIECIAVLPFQDDRVKKINIPNLKEDPVGIIRESFYAHLSPLSYRDIEISRIDYLLNEQKVEEKDILSYLQEQNCHSYVRGSIKQIKITDLKIYSTTTLEMEVFLYDIKTNNVLWEAKKTTQSRGGDLPMHPISLVTGAYKAYKNTQVENILQLIDSLNRQLISTLPKGKVNNYDPPETIVKVKASQSTLESLVEENQNDPQYLKDLITFHLSSGRYEKAQELSAKGVEIHNTHEFYFFSGRALLKLQNYEKSEKMFIKAIALQPDQYMYYNALGYLYSSTKQSEKALAAYQMGIDQNYENPFAHYNMAIEYINKGDFDIGIEKLYLVGKMYLKEEKYNKVVLVINELGTMQKEGFDVKKELEDLKSEMDKLFMEA